MIGTAALGVEVMPEAEELIAVTDKQALRISREQESRHFKCKYFLDRACIADLPRFPTLFLYLYKNGSLAKVLCSASYSYYMLGQSYRNQNPTQGILGEDNLKRCEQDEGNQKGMLWHPKNSN